MKITDIVYQDDFVFAVCKFLDEFKRSENKYEMISNEPQGIIDNANRCLLAAISHKLANDCNIDVPAWVNKTDYFLPFPVYSFGTTNKEYQEYLESATPYEFASRNIFYGANAIERV